jgi:hypothetical protein
VLGFPIGAEKPIAGNRTAIRDYADGFQPTVVSFPGHPAFKRGLTKSPLDWAIDRRCGRAPAPSCDGAFRTLVRTLRRECQEAVRILATILRFSLIARAPASRMGTPTAIGSAIPGILIYCNSPNAGEGT